MRSIRITLFVVTTMLCNHLIIAQSSESDELTYKAYLDSRDAEQSKQNWKKIVASKQQEYDNKPNKNSLFSLALAQFGLLNATMRTKDEALFDEFIDRTEANLEMLKKDIPAEAKALHSSVFGLQMGYSPWKGILLGSKSSSMMEKAKKEDPDSPLVWKLYANSKYFTPETWGGDLKEAIRAYEKSLQLYESDASKTTFNWLYLDTLAFLGQAYSKNGESSKAIGQYEKALQIEPEFYWVKHSLLPKARELNSVK